VTDPNGTAAPGGERIDVVTVHLPQRRGRAAERALLAWVLGALRLGCDVRVTSWSSYAPREPLPPWCEHRTLPERSAAARHLTALRRPRSDAYLLGWEPRPGAWAVADDVVSVAAVAGLERSVMVAHYSTVLDQWALRRAQPKHLQDVRHERRAARMVRIPTAYSARVAHRFGAGVAVIPIALEPSPPSPFVEDPVAVLPADWTWAPNLAALAVLLRQWPSVRAMVPGARLLLAGSGLPAGIRSTLPTGVEALGHLPVLAELWAQAAVLAFPCPRSSGPKVKVLEAAMAGVPIVTTAHGMEGLSLDGVTVAPASAFAEGLGKLLADPSRRAGAGEAARASALAHHAPEPAARRRLAVWRDSCVAGDRRVAV
jgi:Glycosyl transferases group 1